MKRVRQDKSRGGAWIDIDTGQSVPPTWRFSDLQVGDQYTRVDGATLTVAEVHRDSRSGAVVIVARGTTPAKAAT